MGKFVSPYYPPRAHWYGSIFPWGARLRRRVALDRIPRPLGFSWLQLIAAVLVPGLAVYIRGPRIYGRAALGLAFSLFLIFAAELGRPMGNLAFGLLLALHATGINYLLAPLFAGVRFGYRVLFSMGLLVVLGTLLYAPAQNFAAAHGVTPMRIRDRVIVVRGLGAAGSIRRGDLVAYTISANGDHNGMVYAGYGLGPVLGLGGDHVRFTPTAIEINGRPQARVSTMPASGDLVVPEKCWFVWPELDITGHGNVPAATLTQLLLSMSTISESQLVGKPFKHWFWHRQFPL